MTNSNHPVRPVVTVRNPDYDLQFDHWEMMDDLSKGASAVKEKSIEYLPPTELEQKEMRGSGGADSTKQTRYAQRLQRAVFINGVDRLTKFAVGHLFRESVKIPDKFEKAHPKLSKNADLLGTDLRQFIKNVSTRSYIMGHQFVVVDMPKNAPSSLQEQKDGNWRPYFVSLDPRDLIDWSISTREDGTPELEWATIVRTETESRVPFVAPQPKFVYMVWYKDKWERYSERAGASNEERNSPVFEDTGPNPLGEVPIYPIYSNLERPMVSRPPLLEAGYINLNHYQTYSMFNNGLMYHLNPFLAIIGIQDEGDVKLTATSAVYLPRDCDAKYVEFQGAGLQIAESSAKALSEEMMEAGLRSTTFLGANTSAEARRVAKSDFNAFLISVANSYEHGWMNVFRAANMWMGVPSDNEKDFKPIFNKDFDVTIMDAGLARFYLESLQAGAISQKTFLKSMVRGDVFAKELDVEKEMKESLVDSPRFVPAKATGGASNLNPPASAEPAKPASGDVSPEGTSRGDGLTKRA